MALIDMAWGHNSVGRVPALQAGCRRFDSVWLHHFCSFDELSEVRTTYDANEFRRIMRVTSGLTGVGLRPTSYCE